MSTSRQFSRLDVLLTEIGQALALGAGHAVGQGGTRPTPAADIEDTTLTEGEKKLSAALMRVNHAGEVAAQGLYLGQSLAAADAGVRQHMRSAAAEEGDHLRWCEQRLTELDSRTSHLDPLWYLGSVAIGVLAGRAGNRWSFGFVEETERQVMRHLDRHLGELPQQDAKSRAILTQMKYDEGQHAHKARAAGARQLPRAVKTAMALTAKLMTVSARYI